MSTGQSNTTEKLPLPREEANGSPPVQAPDFAELIQQIKKLVEKLEAPKRKSIWDVFPVLTTFLGTVVLASISLYVTQSYQRQEAQRTRDFQTAEADRASKFHEAQLEMQHAQMRVEELKALTALAPLLASHDTAARNTARQLLQAINATGTVPSAPEKTGAATTTQKGEVNDRNRSNASFSEVVVHPPARSTSSSVLDQFAAIALSSENSAEERAAATRKIGDIATARTASTALRERATNIAAQIAVSTEAPASVKAAAAEVIAKIKSVPPDEIVQIVNSQSSNRKITEVILHDAGIDASSYKGAQTITAIAKLQLERFGAKSFGWHYAISADGAIWLGVPLDQTAIHTRGHNQTGVSIMLFLDGNKELPSDAQRTSLAQLLRALFGRLKINPAPNAPDGLGFHFHRDYDRYKTCPGTLLTKEMVLGWL